MTTAQSIRIYEILQKHFGDNEEARAVVSAIEAIVDEKTTEKQTTFTSAIAKDLADLRNDMRLENAQTRTMIAESKVDTIKWTFSFFATLTLLIIGLYLK